MGIRHSTLGGLYVLPAMALQMNDVIVNDLRQTPSADEIKNEETKLMNLIKGDDQSAQSVLNAFKKQLTNPDSFWKERDVTKNITDELSNWLKKGLEQSQQFCKRTKKVSLDVINELAFSGSGPVHDGIVSILRRHTNACHLLAAIEAVDDELKGIDTNAEDLPDEVLKPVVEQLNHEYWKQTAVPNEIMKHVDDMRTKRILKNHNNEVPSDKQFKALSEHLTSEDWRGKDFSEDLVQTLKTQLANRSHKPVPENLIKELILTDTDARIRVILENHNLKILEGRDPNPETDEIQNHKNKLVELWKNAQAPPSEFQRWVKSDDGASNLHRPAYSTNTVKPQHHRTKIPADLLKEYNRLSFTNTKTVAGTDYQEVEYSYADESESEAKSQTVQKKDRPTEHTYLESFIRAVRLHSLQTSSFDFLWVSTARVVVLSRPKRAQGNDNADPDQLRTESLSNLFEGMTKVVNDVETVQQFEKKLAECWLSDTYYQAEPSDFKSWSQLSESVFDHYVEPKEIASKRLARLADPDQHYRNNNKARVSRFFEEYADLLLFGKVKNIEGFASQEVMWSEVPKQEPDRQTDQGTEQKSKDGTKPGSGQESNAKQNDRYSKKLEDFIREFNPNSDRQALANGTPDQIAFFQSFFQDLVPLRVSPSRVVVLRVKKGNDLAAQLLKFTEAVQNQANKVLQKLKEQVRALWKNVKMPKSQFQNAKHDSLNISFELFDRLSFSKTNNIGGISYQEARYSKRQVVWHCIVARGFMKEMQKGDCRGALSRLRDPYFEKLESELLNKHRSGLLPIRVSKSRMLFLNLASGSNPSEDGASQFQDQVEAATKFVDGIKEKKKSK